MIVARINGVDLICPSPNRVQAKIVRAAADHSTGGGYRPLASDELPNDRDADDLNSVSVGRNICRVQAPVNAVDTRAARGRPRPLRSNTSFWDFCLRRRGISKCLGAFSPRIIVYPWRFTCTRGGRFIDLQRRELHDAHRAQLATSG
jgi:hypothetical protein